MKLSEISDVRSPETLVDLEFEMKTITDEYITPFIKEKIRLHLIDDPGSIRIDKYKIVGFSSAGHFYTENMRTGKKYVIDRRSMAKMYKLLEVFQEEPEKISIDQYLINEYEDKNNASHKG